MARAIAVQGGVIRRGLVAELEAFRAPDGLPVSSYYLNLNPPVVAGDPRPVRVALEDALARLRERIDQLDVRPAVRHALRRDWEMVGEVAPAAVGERSTRGLACFVASEAGYGRALRLPWPVRDRAFFEDRFVLWPLRQLLDQSDRYGIILTDKEEARLFLFFFEQIEEVASVLDEVPGRVRFPDPIRQYHYTHKHVEYFHRHFEKVAEVALRLFEREPFEHAIIGGRHETLPQFESHLHRYVRDRIIARWDIDVRTPTPQVLERALQEEQQFLEQEARAVWKAIQDYRRQRGAVGPEEVFAALWQRRVQTLLAEPGVGRSGFRCPVCGRLQQNAGPCVECGGQTAAVADVLEEAVHDAIEQDAQVRYWKDPVLHEAGSVAAFRRY